MGEDELLVRSSAPLLSKDVQHLDRSLGEFRTEMKDELRGLRADMKEFGKSCTDNTVAIAKLEEQVKQGDKNTSTIATVVSAAFSTIGAIVATIMGGKP
jgi:septal ring factor EnvC (AmiA/AmiB activator)